jgi:hypothetical protein
MLARRTVPFAVLALAVATLAGCATDNPLTAAGIDSTAPGAPTNLAASDRSGSLVLSWDASADADVVGYDVYRYSPDPARENSYVKINGAIVTGNEYVVSDASDAASWYRVKAVDASSNASPASGALAAAAPGVGSVTEGSDLPEPGIERTTRP